MRAAIRPSTEWGRESTSLPDFKDRSNSTRNNGFPAARSARAVTWPGSRGWSLVAELIKSSACGLGQRLQLDAEPPGSTPGRRTRLAGAPGEDEHPGLALESEQEAGQEFAGSVIHPVGVLDHDESRGQ